MNARFWGAAFYFFYFGAIGCWFPYLNLHYQQIGLAKQQIGLLAALPTLITLFASPLWAGLADKLRAHKRLLTAAMLLTPIALLLLVRTNNFVLLIGFVMLQAILSAPISPLGDNAVLELLGEERHRYSSLRLWGAVGFGITALGGGFIIEQVGIAWAVAAYAVLMWLAAFVTTRLPAPQASAPPQLRDLGLITRDSRWFWFLMALMLVGFCATLFMNFMALYFSQLGGTSSWYGFTIAVASFSELFVFGLAPRIIQNGQARTLLMVSFGAYALRALITSLIDNAYWGLIPQAMHGLCFAALWSASVAYAREIAPPGWNATAQSLISVVHFGVGAGGGALLAGALYDGVGPVVLFRVACLSAIVGLLAFAMSQRGMQRQTDTPHPPHRPHQTSP
jgi:MFS family permease